MRWKVLVGSSLVVLALWSGSDPQPQLSTPGERATFTRRGAELSLAGHAVVLRVASIARDERALRLEAPSPRCEGEDVRWARGSGVVEWWRRRGDDLEHGVTLSRRPEGRGVLAVGLAIDGASPVPLDDRAVLLRTTSGEALATYGGLTVLDADGRQQPARLAVVDGRARIEIDDREARYPLIVDPLVATQEALLGNSVTTGAPKAVAISGDGSRVVAATSVYARTGTTWALETTLTAAGATTSFGYAAAVSDDGARIALGDPAFNSGAAQSGRVLVYARVGTLWTVEATLTDPGAPQVSDLFGQALAMSADGTRIAVGCPGDDALGVNAGGVFVFHRSSAGAWTSEVVPPPTGVAAGDQLGSSVALSADGLRLASGSAYDGSPAIGGGSVSVYTRSGTTWSFDTTLATPASGFDAARFGRDVALDGDGSHLLVAAGSPAGGTSGAYAYDRAATGAWTRNTSLTIPTVPSGDRSVSIADDGLRAIVGSAPVSTETGVVRVFRRTGATWMEETTLPPMGLASGTYFGPPVVLSHDGSRAAANGSGVRVFTLRDSTGGACRTGEACSSGFCVDGVCCSAACDGPCEACTIAAGGTANGTCTPLEPTMAAATVCRAAVDVCDLAETCSASSRTCPGDGFEPSGTECRAVHGTCDVREVCTGAGAACPPDLALSLGTSCRRAMGTCDVEEQCDGTAFDCPPDAFRASGVTCDATINGPCDLPDTCDGASAACPARYQPMHSPCGPAPSGVCDAPDECTGASAECLPSFVTGVECRPAAGGCDLPEACSGGAADCPPDDVEAAGMVCRASTDATCDPAESCDGLGAACPADVTTCTGTDAGGPVDGGARDAGATGADASSTTDAGSSTPPAAGGCACRAGAGDPRVPSELAFLVLVAAAILRGRRVRARRRRGPASRSVVRRAARRAPSAVRRDASGARARDGRALGGGGDSHTMACEPEHGADRIAGHPRSTAAWSGAEVGGSKRLRAEDLVGPATRAETEVLGGRDQVDDTPSACDEHVLQHGAVRRDAPGHDAVGEADEQRGARAR